MRNALLTICLVLSGALLSAGCGNNGNDGGPAAAPPSGSGCGDALCIGILLRRGDVHGSVARATELARDDVNKGGGNVKLVFGSGDSAKTLEDTKKFLEMGVRAVVGPPSSASSLAIFDFLNENRMVAVSPSATSVTLTEKNSEISRAGGTPFFFRTVPNDSFQSKIFAHITEGSVLIVYRNDNYGIKLAELIEKELLARGRPAPVTVRYERYLKYDPDFDGKTRAVLDDIERARGIGDIDSAVLIVSDAEGGKIIRGMLDSSVVPSSVRYFVSDSFAVRNLHELVDPENPARIKDFQGTAPCGLPDPPQRRAEFEKRFDRKKYPSLEFAVHAYDAVAAIALAARSAGSADPAVYVSRMAEVTGGGTKCISYGQCAAALSDETSSNDDIDYEGVSGPITFDENGDISEGCYSVYTYDGRGGGTERLFHVPDLKDITPGS